MPSKKPAIAPDCPRAFDPRMTTPLAVHVDGIYPDVPARDLTEADIYRLAFDRSYPDQPTDEACAALLARLIASGIYRPHQSPGVAPDQPEV